MWFRKKRRTVKPEDMGLVELMQYLESVHCSLMVEAAQSGSSPTFRQMETYRKKIAQMICRRLGKLAHFEVSFFEMPSEQREPEPHWCPHVCKRTANAKYQILNVES